MKAEAPLRTIILLGAGLATAGCATPQSSKPPQELTPEGHVIARARKRSGSEGDYRVRTASIAGEKSSQEFVQSLRQEINVYKDGARYSDVRIVDVDKDGHADTLCVVSGQFFANGHVTVDGRHCRKLPAGTVPMKIPLESAVEFVHSLEAE